MNPQRFLDNLGFVFQPGRKPGLLNRLARSYWRAMTRRDVLRFPLRNVDVALGYACNLACEHCSCAMFTSGRSPMGQADYESLAGQALELGAIYFAFTGGEPLLHPGLEDLMQLFAPKSTLLGLQTNALLLDARRAASLRRAGLDAIQVSLDSGDPEVHDSFRNHRGAFRQTLENVSAARALGIRVIFSSTLTHSSLREPATTELLDFAKSLGVPVVISVPCPVGRWSGDLSEQFTEDDRTFLAGLMRRYPQLRRDFHSNYLRLGCSAGSEKLYITPYGDVIPCPFIHIGFGNVTREPLARIRARMLNLDRLGEYSQICLAGEDNGFIDAFIRPTYESRLLPMSWRDHPALGGLDGAKVRRPAP